MAAADSSWGHAVSTLCMACGAHLVWRWEMLRRIVLTCSPLSFSLSLSLSLFLSLSFSLSLKGVNDSRNRAPCFDER